MIHVIFEETDKQRFSLHYTSGLVPINSFHHDLLKETERDGVKLLEEFYNMSTREVATKVIRVTKML